MLITFVSNSLGSFFSPGTSWAVLLPFSSRVCECVNGSMFVSGLSKWNCGQASDMLVYIKLSWLAEAATGLICKCYTFYRIARDSKMTNAYEGSTRQKLIASQMQYPNTEPRAKPYLDRFEMVHISQPEMNVKSKIGFHFVVICLRPSNVSVARF